MSSGDNGLLQHNADVSPTDVSDVPMIRDPPIAETYLSRQLMGLSITLIIIGGLSFISIFIGHNVDDALYTRLGAYCGVQFIINGALGIGTKRLFIINGALGIDAARKKKRLIVIFMIFSIKSAIEAIPMLGIGFIGTLPCAAKYPTNNNCATTAAITRAAVQAVLAAVAGTMSIWGSAICCRVVCCCAPTYYSAVTAPYRNQQVMIIRQQQQQPVGAVPYARPLMMPMTSDTCQTSSKNLPVDDDDVPLLSCDE